MTLLLITEKDRSSNTGTSTGSRNSLNPQGWVTQGSSTFRSMKSTWKQLSNQLKHFLISCRIDAEKNLHWPGRGLPMRLESLDCCQKLMADTLTQRDGATH